MLVKLSLAVGVLSHHSLASQPGVHVCMQHAHDLFEQIGFNPKIRVQRNCIRLTDLNPVASCGKIHQATVQKKVKGV